MEIDEALVARKRRLFEEMVTACGRKEFDRFETYFVSDAIFDMPYLPLPDFPSRLIGVHAIRVAIEAGMADFDPYRHKVTQFYDCVEPDLLIAEYESDTVYHPTERKYANKYLGIVRFDGEKISYWKEYLNPLTIKEVMGL
jgi:ketosteroid isomerase-like protein